MPEILNPPRGASLLLRLFAGETDFPQIEGDLREEFCQRAIGDQGAARRWYRREAIRNVWVLARMAQTLGIIFVALVSALVAAWSPGPFVIRRSLLALGLVRPSFLIAPPSGWQILLSFAALAFACGWLATSAFSARVWLLRLAFVGWNIAMLTYYLPITLVWGFCWFLLGSAYCAERIRRQLAVGRLRGRRGVA